MQFDSNLSSTTYTNNQGSRRSDKIIIPKAVNNTSIDSFADIKSLSTNNADGWAKLNLGNSNFITVVVSLEDLTSDSFILLHQTTKRFMEMVITTFCRAQTQMTG